MRPRLINSLKYILYCSMKLYKYDIISECSTLIISRWKNNYDDYLLRVFLSQLSSVQNYYRHSKMTT